MRLMSATVTAVLAVATALSTSQASACMRPVEKAAFEVEGVKSELMVVAITCQAQDRYNTFVTHFKRDLQGGETALNRYFARTASGHAQREHDAYITNLANAQMQDGLKQGDQFCTRHMPLFDSVMTLHGTQDLTAYAEANAITQPVDLTECPVLPSKKTRTASKK